MGTHEGRWYGKPMLTLRRKSYQGTSLWHIEEWTG